MTSRTPSLERSSPLARALPDAQFGERHSRVVDAGPERVWQVLNDVRWRDLTFTKMFVAVRMGPWSAGDDARMVERGPGMPIHAEPPRTMTSGLVGRPWRVPPELGPHVRDLDELRAFRRPGWLKFGMEWTLTALPGGRTFVETTTLCQATDEAARRRFALYWAVIRPFSGLIRRDLLGVVARRAATTR